MSKLLEDLKYRDLVYQQTDEEGIKELLEKESVSIYCGTDPTGNSLHIGHLLPFLTLKRFQQHGHKPVILVGGGTGIIGDPSGRSEERQLQSLEVIEDNARRLEGQLRNIFRGDDNIEFVNNLDWLGKLSMIEFLRDYGKLVNINYLLAKDSISSRLDNGLSFTEFSYTILQGIDYAYLNEHHNVKLQIGGSDQWGNMTAGTELLRRKADKSGHVITVPLITDSTGKKFGKSEGNAVWLDATKTTPYEMYQFWLNVMDDDAVRFLKIFTFLSLEEIEEIGKEFDQARHQRLAQKVLAREVVTLVHGKEAYEQAVHITEQLFAGNLKALSARDLKVALNGVPTYEISGDENLNIVELLVNAKISPSKRQAREDVQNGAIYINGERVQDLDYTLSDADKIDNEITVIRRGKKKNFVLTY